MLTSGIGVGEEACREVDLFRYSEAILDSKGAAGSEGGNMYYESTALL